MSNSRVSQFSQILKDAFGWNDGREEYIPVPSSSSQVTETIRPPEDSYQIMYLIFLLQGVTMLLGWNGIYCIRNIFIYFFKNRI